jgi:hypothetical protein
MLPFASILFGFPELSARIAIPSGILKLPANGVIISLKSEPIFALIAMSSQS